MTVIDRPTVRSCVIVSRRAPGQMDRGLADSGHAGGSSSRFWAAFSAPFIFDRDTRWLAAAPNALSCRVLGRLLPHSSVSPL